VNWGATGDRYFHPFSAFGFDIDGLGFHQVWHWLSDKQQQPPLDVFNIGAQAAARAKFLRTNSDDPRSPLSQLRHAYHIDAGRYAAFLRRYAEQRGVVHIDGRIESAQRDETSGDITHLTLASGDTVHGDFFIDCTGFRALLIGETLGAGWIDWAHWLPCDRAIAVPSQPARRLDTATRSTAHDAGWCWRIPLQHRTGNGNVYCSAFMSDEAAEQTLLAGLDTAPTDTPRPLRFQTGRRDALWYHNCVAIGLSSGFLEPLESTSIHLIQEGISKLLALFPGEDDAAHQRTTYNQLMIRLYDDIRDFIVLHYHVNRNEQPFWRALREMKIPDTLAERIDGFQARGQWFAHRADLFTETSWVAVMMGQGLAPSNHHPLLASLDTQRTQQQLNEMANVYGQASEHMPPHQAYIQKFCMADDNAYQDKAS
ncbi:MAG: tryptophan halogenase family protein, partial [Pseudomonadota bacterium]